MASESRIACSPRLVCYHVGAAPSLALKMGGDPPGDAWKPGPRFASYAKRLSYLARPFRDIFPNLTGSRRSKTQKLFRFGHFGIPFL